MSLQLLLGLAALAQKPLFEFPSDETGHFGMARFVAFQHRLPGPIDFPTAPPVSQYTQPPLFYVVTAPLLWALDDNSPIPGQSNANPDCNSYNGNLTSWARPGAFTITTSGAVRTGYALRLVLLVMTVATTWFIYQTALLLLPGQYDVAALSAALFAFMPTLAVQRIAINNDSPVMLLGAVLIYTAARSTITTNPRTAWKHIALSSVLAILAVLTKVTGWAAFGLLAFLIGQRFASSRASRRVGCFAASLLILAAVGIGLFNLAHYGSLIGRYDQVLKGTQPVGDVLRHAVDDLLHSVTMPDEVNGLPLRGAVRLHNATFALIVVGGGLLLLRAVRGEQERRLTLLMLAMIAPAMTLILLRNFNYPSSLFNYAPFRYLGPAVPTLAILAALALAVWPRAIRALLLVGVPSIWFVLSLLLVFFSPDTATARRAFTVNSALPAGAVPVINDKIGFPIHVVGYERASDDTFDDGTVTLTLYMETDVELPSPAYALQLSVNGAICRVMPAGGLYPTTRLKKGQVVGVHVTLPYCEVESSPTPVDVEYTWQEIMADGHSVKDPIGAERSLFSLPALPARRARHCLENIATFGGAFRVTKASVPALLSPAQPFIPYVQWQVKQVTSISYVRAFVLREPSGVEIARCAGIPRRNTFPTTLWRQADTIYFDECETDVSKAIPGTTYTVWLGLYDPLARRWLQHDQAGTDPFVQIGTTAAQ
jgi:hypothetical protein